MKIKIPKITSLPRLFNWLKPSKHRKPYRDWFFIVCFSVFSTLTFLVLAAILYYEIDRDMIFRDAPLSSDVPLQINRQEVDSVSGFYVNQEKTINNLTGTTTKSSGAVDPSL